MQAIIPLPVRVPVSLSIIILYVVQVVLYGTVVPVPSNEYRTEPTGIDHAPVTYRYGNITLELPNCISEITHHCSQPWFLYVSMRDKKHSLVVLLLAVGLVSASRKQRNNEQSNSGVLDCCSLMLL